MPAHLVSSSLLWIATLATQGTDPATIIDTDQTALGCARCAALKASIVAESPFDLMRDVDRAADSDTDVLHYDLDLDIIPTTQSLSGTNVITVRSLVPALNDFDVSISDVFTVSVTVNGLPAAWVRLSPSLIRITLDHTYVVDEEFDVAVTYSGVATAGGGFGSLTWSTSSGLPYVYTLSEPYYAYTWWPTKDVSTDKATADLRLTVPGAVKVASNGVLLTNTLNPDTTRTFHYQTNYQTSPYLFCFGVGNYNFFSDVYTHALGSTPLDFALLAASDTPGNRAAWLKVKDMLPVFEPVFGLYPFHEEKYGIYQFGFGGGMEHQTMTGQGTTNESVCAHELGHQWWGDMTTCETWNHIWLNEGFATYSEALWEERKGGSPNAIALKNAMAARKPSSYGNSVYVPTITDVNRIFNSNSTYLKGGWVMHMLRHKVGDAMFFQALADYRAAYEFSTATTEDFRDSVEATTGQDLDQFFTQWVYWTGAPTFRYAFRAHLIDGQNYAEIYLKQTQTGSPYDLELDMRISTAGGGIDRTLPLSTVLRHYLFPLANAPTALQADPNGWLLYASASTIAFVEGPSRIVSSTPAPGAVVAHGSVTEIGAKFHKSVNIGVSDVFVTGATVGPVAVSASYDAVAKRVAITPLSTLFADTYTVTIADTVTETAAGLALDGEIVGGVYPSGDGLPGGAASFTFVVSPPACPGDVSGDGVTNITDFNILSSNFGGAVPNGTQGDLSGDGFVDIADFNIFAGNFGCPG